MEYKITGVSTPFGGVSWEKEEGDSEIARSVVVFMEDRRVLVAGKYVESPEYATASVLKTREFLTEKISGARPGRSLEQCLRAMRSSCKNFVTLAGPRGINFGAQTPEGLDPFGLALGQFRAEVGAQLAVLLAHFPMDIEEDLQTILPPDGSE